METDAVIDRIACIRERAHALLVAELARRGAVGLVPSHGGILAQLYRQGCLPMGRLAGLIGRRKNTVTTLVRKLEAAGYVTRTRDADDERRVQVALTPAGAALKAKAAPDDVVYVFARALQGPRMPLAVVRAKVSDLPMDFALDDSMAMSPELKLSSATELRIEARVSRSGDAIAKPGDLTGELSPVRPGAKGLQLSIDRVVP